jgi:2-keto-4-pentenoate hydratase/2-oxohepta-3-ene-1,7-dioic acid hydratase in catechol pathway
VRTVERRRLERGGASPTAAARVAESLTPGSMTAALDCGDAFWDAARRAADDSSGDAVVAPEPVFLCPVDPPAYRDFMVFEEHFSFGYRWQDLPVPDVLYEFPISYMGSTQAFLGPEAVVPWPGYTDEMDIELELGIVIRRTTKDVPRDRAAEVIAGLTILNDFSARDIQRREMKGSLGPSKGKHFASSAGPWIATMDEIPAQGLRMRSRVNGEQWADTSSSEMIWSIEDIVCWAAAGEHLAAGTLLGTGTCNGGSGVEIGRRLAPGDIVELEVEKLGTLRNSLSSPSPTWMPTAKSRG